MHPVEEDRQSIAFKNLFLLLSSGLLRRCKTVEGFQIKCYRGFQASEATIVNTGWIILAFSYLEMDAGSNLMSASQWHVNVYTTSIFHLAVYQFILYQTISWRHSLGMRFRGVFSQVADDITLNILTRPKLWIAIVVSLYLHLSAR